MIAGALAERNSTHGISEQDIRAGVKMADMAPKLDLVFAGELTRLCGPSFWNEVRKSVGEHCRAGHRFPDWNYRQCVIAAMLATGPDDFRDLILPLLSGKDQQVRHGT